jgi:hypothetical protein
LFNLHIELKLVLIKKLKQILHRIVLRMRKETLLKFLY